MEIWKIKSSDAIKSFGHFKLKAFSANEKSNDSIDLLTYRNLIQNHENETTKRVFEGKIQKL